MDYFLVLAIAIPFLFLVGVVYNALKDQKKLEQGKLKEILAERQRKGYIPPAYDDEDDYGIPARTSAKAQETAATTASKKAETAPVQDAGNSAAVKSDANKADKDIQAQDPASDDESSESELLQDRPLGPTNLEAKDASSYFSKYH